MSWINFSFRILPKKGVVHLATFKFRSKVLVLLFFVFSCSLSAQRMFFDGNYDYSFNGHLVEGVSEIDFASKYSAGSDSVYIFSRKLSVLYFNASEVREFYLDSMLIIGNNPDSLIVKFRNDGPEHLLYDFNLEVGSVYTIHTDHWANPGSDSMHVTVLGYGDTLISGQAIPYQTVEYTFDRSPYTIVDNLYKGIGSLRFYFEIFDIFGNQLGGGIGGPLVCYNSPEINYINEALQDEYINDISDECLTISSVDVRYEKSITVYPNPFISNFTIEADSPFSGLLNLYDLNGKMVLEKQLPKSSEATKHQLDASNLPSGIYHGQVQTKEGLKHFKIIKK